MLYGPIPQRQSEPRADSTKKSICHLPDELPFITSSPLTMSPGVPVTKKYAKTSQVKLSTSYNVTDVLVQS